jgi:hypothetical protein
VSFVEIGKGSRRSTVGVKEQLFIGTMSGFTIEGYVFLIAYLLLQILVLALI